MRERQCSKYSSPSIYLQRQCLVGFTRSKPDLNTRHHPSNRTLMHTSSHFHQFSGHCCIDSNSHSKGATHVIPIRGSASWHPLHPHAWSEAMKHIVEQAQPSGGIKSCPSLQMTPWTTAKKVFVAVQSHIASKQCYICRYGINGTVMPSWPPLISCQHDLSQQHQYYALVLIKPSTNTFQAIGQLGSSMMCMSAWV